MTKIWQVAAGKPGRDYSDAFLRHDVMFVGPGDAGPFTAENPPGKASLRRFYAEVEPGDIVLMRRQKHVVAIGRIVADDYQHSPAFDDIYGWDLQHTRRVAWQKLTQPEALFANQRRMPRFGLFAEVPAHLLDLVKGTPGDLKPLPEAPSESLSPAELEPLLTARGVPHAARVRDALEHHRSLLRWYDAHPDTRPNEHEIVAYLVIPLLRALGWTEQQLAVEWNDADLVAFREPSRAVADAVLVCEVKARAAGLGDTLAQALRYAAKLPHCRHILITQGTRFAVYIREPNQAWPGPRGPFPPPVHYLNIERLRVRHAFPANTSAVDALHALTPESVCGPGFVTAAT